MAGIVKMLFGDRKIHTTNPAPLAPVLRGEGLGVRVRAAQSSPAFYGFFHLRPTSTFPSNWLSGIAQAIRFITCFFCLATASTSFAQAQTPPTLPAPVAAPAPAAIQNVAAENAVRLSTQGEIPLRDLVEYVAQRLGFRVFYDASLAQKKINLIAPDPIPVASLLDVLQSVLRTEGLVLTEEDASGSKRIVPIERISEVARPTRSPEQLRDAGAASPLTQVFTLKNADSAKIVTLITPFLSAQGASIVALENQPVVIVTDVAENVRRAAELIEILDTGKPQVDVKFVTAKFVSAADLAKKLSELLAARGRALGRAQGDATGVEVTVETRTNQLILIGNTIDVSRAVELLLSLDTELKTTQATFSAEFISPTRLDEVVRGMIEGRVLRPPYQSRIEGNVLIVDSTPEVLELIGRIRRQLDTREAPASQSPIRFYKVKNVPAEELAQTIISIAGGATSGLQQRETLPDRRLTTNDRAIPGPNLPPALLPGTGVPGGFPGQIALPIPPAVVIPANGQPFAAGAANAIGNQANLPPFDQFGQNELYDPNGERLITPKVSAIIGEAQVTVDVNTNTIVVVAQPEVQRIYATLIETLDQRSTQVLVEAKIVIIDTSDNYSLGVEISGGDRSGLRRLFAFSSYGLSQVDAVSGALTILPGVGFNGTLVDPSTADAVVRALASHRRARVLSTPKILVNDNAEGQLTSVLEVPFTSVNASQTVATTSFAGFAEAGTTITVTPTISEDDHLQLDYVVTLNSFTGTGSAGVPPPRQTNEVRSRITIPDGFTVIVGGLTSKNSAYQIRGFPILENIPIIRALTSSQSDDTSSTSLFVFLKPVILREDRFKDLKYLSENDLHAARLPGDFPGNEPLLIE